MKPLIKAIMHNIPFWVLTIVAILMLIVSLFIPPEGEIHRSVLEGVAEIIGLFALWTVVYALKTGAKTTVRHNGTEVSIDGDGE